MKWAVSPGHVIYGVPLPGRRDHSIFTRDPRGEGRLPSLFMVFPRLVWALREVLSANLLLAWEADSLAIYNAPAPGKQILSLFTVLSAILLAWEADSLAIYANPAPENTFCRMEPSRASGLPRASQGLPRTRS